MQSLPWPSFASSSSFSSAAATQEPAPFSFHCTICFNAFHPTIRYPVVLPCGHTFICHPCSLRLRRCMECRTSFFQAPSGKTKTIGAGGMTAARRSVGRDRAVPPSKSDSSSEIGAPLPLPRNLLLLSLMEVARAEVQAKTSSLPNGKENDEDDEEEDLFCMTLSDDELSEDVGSDGRNWNGNTTECDDADDNDNDWIRDDIDEDGLVRLGMRVLNGTCGTYVVMDRLGLVLHRDSVLKLPSTGVGSNVDVDREEQNPEVVNDYAEREDQALVACSSPGVVKGCDSVVNSYHDKKYEEQLSRLPNTRDKLDSDHSGTTEDGVSSLESEKCVAGVLVDAVISYNVDGENEEKEERSSSSASQTHMEMDADETGINRGFDGECRRGDEDDTSCSKNQNESNTTILPRKMEAGDGNTEGGTSTLTCQNDERVLGLSDEFDCEDVGKTDTGSSCSQSQGCVGSKADGECTDEIGNVSSSDVVTEPDASVRQETGGWKSNNDSASCGDRIDTYVKGMTKAEHSDDGSNDDSREQKGPYHGAQDDDFDARTPGETISFGSRIQVVCIEKCKVGEGYYQVKLARKRGYLLISCQDCVGSRNMSQLIKVGPAIDRACVIESMIHTLQERYKNLNCSRQNFARIEAFLNVKLRNVTGNSQSRGVHSSDEKIYTGGGGKNGTIPDTVIERKVSRDGVVFSTAGTPRIHLDSDGSEDGTELRIFNSTHGPQTIPPASSWPRDELHNDVSQTPDATLPARSKTCNSAVLSRPAHLGHRHGKTTVSNGFAGSRKKVSKRVDFRTGLSGHCALQSTKAYIPQNVKRSMVRMMSHYKAISGAPRSSGGSSARVAASVGSDGDSVGRRAFLDCSRPRLESVEDETLSCRSANMSSTENVNSSNSA